jgi:predicted alpha/beta superfamily hydrolase
MLLRCVCFAFCLCCLFSVVGCSLGSQSPDSINNYSAQLSVKAITSQLSMELALSIEDVLIVHFYDDGTFKITQKNRIGIYDEGSFVYKKIDKMTSEMSALSSRLKKSYAIKFNFRTKGAGDYEIKISGGSVFLTGAFTAQKNAIPDVKLRGTIQSDLSITSSITQSTYPYHIYLPADYATLQKNYPVVYMTDAQWGYLYYARYLDSKQKDVIFIGVEQGQEDRRFVDFVPTGALKYTQFLKEEFIPFIETKFRVTHERTYMGISLGGLLGSILLAQEPVGTPYFNNYFLFDGTYQMLTDANIKMEEDRLKANKQLNVRVLLTSASPGNRESVAELAKRYRARPYEGLNLTVKEYSVPHKEIGWPSFVDAVESLFAK